jgi:hypothetical protein
VGYPREVHDHIVQSSSVEDKHTSSRYLARIFGEWALRADKHGTFNARLFPTLRSAVERVDDGIGSYAEDGVDGGEIALQHGEVELSVCAWRWWRVVGMYGGGIGFVI